MGHHYLGGGLGGGLGWIGWRGGWGTGGGGGVGLGGCGDPQKGILFRLFGMSSFSNV